MVNLGNRSHGALSTTSTCALLDADGGRNAGDEIDIRAGKLLDELAGIKAHGIQEPPLPLGKEQIKRPSAFPSSADVCHYDKPAAPNTQTKGFEIMSARTPKFNAFPRLS